MNSRFGYSRFANQIARVSGRPKTFVLAAAVIVVWMVTGPLFGFSDTWQLVINTGTTIVTFLMVFLIQNTQNRDSQGAHNALLDLEELEQDNLDEFRRRYQLLASEARKDLARGNQDTGSPEA